MFSQYASKFLSQSVSTSKDESAPLFYSTAEYPEQSIYQQSKSRKLTAEDEEEDAEEEEDIWGTAKPNLEASVSTASPSASMLAESKTLESSMRSVRLENTTVLDGALHSDDDDEDDHAPPETLLAEHSQAESVTDLPGLLSKVSGALQDSKLFARDRAESAGAENDPRMLPYDPDMENPVLDEPADIPADMTTSLVLTSAKFDSPWDLIYLGCIAMVFSFHVIIWLKTEVPAVIGDTIYTTLHHSVKLLAITSVLSVAISVIWVYLMKNYSAIVQYVSMILVPIALFALSIYINTNISHNRTGSKVGDAQAHAMGWISFALLVCVVGWIASIYPARHSIIRSLGIIKLGCKVLSDHPQLLVLGTAMTSVFFVITAVWGAMFGRIFLSGHALGSAWILDSPTWSLGIFYVLMYLWTWNVFRGIQRCVVTATVSQWYFYRFAVPQPSSSYIIRSAVRYSLTVQFGSICLSSLLSLLIRIPFLVLPRRVVIVVQRATLAFLPASIMTVLSPLALSNCVIKSQSLITSADSISNLRFVDQQIATNSWSGYQLSKVTLSTARIMTSLIMGVVAWTHAAMMTDGGSLYGYTVGLLAGFMAWFILGATEGILSTVVDALFLCFAIDSANHGQSHCPEADRQFGAL